MTRTAVLGNFGPHYILTRKVSDASYVLHITTFLTLSYLKQYYLSIINRETEWSDTTEVLRPDQTGLYTEPHLLVCTLHADMSRSTSSGSVSTFRSDRALAQADDPTSHTKEKTTVTTKSCAYTAGLKWTSGHQLSLGHCFISALFLALRAATTSSILTYAWVHIISFAYVRNENAPSFNWRYKQPATPSLTFKLHYRRSLDLQIET